MTGPEFGWVVTDRKHNVCAERRTEADAEAIRRMLQVATPGEGPFTVERKTQAKAPVSG